MTTVVLVFIGLGGVAFLIRFLIALCRESNRCSGGVVRKLSESMEPDIEIFPSVGVSRAIRRRSQAVDESAGRESSNCRHRIRTGGKRKDYVYSRREHDERPGSIRRGVRETFSPLPRGTRARLPLQPQREWRDVV